MKSDRFIVSTVGLSVVLCAALCVTAADQPSGKGNGKGKGKKATATEPAKPAAAAAEAPKGPIELPKGLVLHYSFEKAPEKRIVPDVSGHGHDGYITSGNWISFGKVGGAYEFYPTGCSIAVTNSVSLPPKKMTVALWFRTSRSDIIWRRILDKRMTKGFGLSIAGDTKGALTRGKLAMVINGSCRSISNVVVADGAWHHGAATYDGAELKLYVDGLLQKQVVACTDAIGENSDNLTVGMNKSDCDAIEKNQSFEGSMDEIMMFERALSEEEIKNMVMAVDPNAGKPKFTKQQVAGRLRQLKLLWEEGLLTDDFYDLKVEECESAK